VNPGLLYLLRLGPLARLRSIRRRLGSRRGLLVTLGALLAFLAILLPQLWLLTRRDPEDLARIAAAARRLGPPLMLALAVTSAFRGRGVYLRPPEVQFLLPAPLARRELLLYLVFSRLGGAVWSTLWLAVFTLRFAPTVPGALAGLFLFNAFLLLLSQASGLAGAALSARLGRRLRRTLLLVAVALVAAALWHARASIPTGAGLMPVLDRALDLPWVRVVAWPMRPFVEVFLAGSLAGALPWAGGALVLLAGLFGLVLLADVAWEESALERSHKVQETMRRIRSGGPAARRPGLKGLAIPDFPRLGGAGTLAWRQVLEILRNFHGLLSLVASFTIMLVILPFAQMSGAATVTIVVLAGFFFQNSPFLAFDLRRDLDRLAWLRSLPMSPLAVVLGEVVPAVLLQTLVQFLFLLAFALFRGPVDPDVWTAAILALPAFNLLAAGLQNLAFLLWPRRLLPEQGADFHFLGRVWGEALLLSLVLALSGGLAFLVASAAWRASGGSSVVAGLAGALLLGVLCLPLYAGLARAFAAFDVSRDLP